MGRVSMISYHRGVAGAAGPPRTSSDRARVYLLDTNVISEFRRRRPHAAVVAWIESVPDAHLHVSAVTLGELQAGVEITREKDPAKAAEIEAWVDRMAGLYNVLPVDGRAFRVWARLMHRRRDDLIPDAMIAATALVHNLTVATRNVRDFRELGVATFDPFAAGLAPGTPPPGRA